MVVMCWCLMYDVGVLIVVVVGVVIVVVVVTF